MICPRTDEQLRADLTNEQRAKLIDHAKTCRTCHDRLRLGAAVRETLRNATPPPAFGAAKRWRTAIDERPARSSFLWPAVAIASTVVVMLFVLRSPKVEPPKPVVTLERGAVHELDGRPLAAMVSDVWMRFEPDSVLHVRGARFETQTQLAMLVPAVSSEPIRVAYGAANITLKTAPIRPFLATPVSTIEFESGEFSATITDRMTTVDARRGAALVRDENGAVRRVRPSAPEPPESKPPPPPPAEPSTADENRRALVRARALVGRDDVRASELAEKVLARRPSKRTEAVALMIAADAWRRRGGHDEAERYYRRAAEHPDGDAFLEEASFRRAALLAELDRVDDAIEVLEGAQFGRHHTALVPERTALLARLLLGRRRIDRAADVLEAVASRSDRILDSPRLHVADALSSDEPERAVALVRPIAGRPGPSRDAARRLIERIEKK